MRGSPSNGSNRTRYSRRVSTTTSSPIGSHTVTDYATDYEDVDDGEATAWLEDLRTVAENGRSFCSLTQYRYFVRKAE